jgi:hypothetical protein
MAIEILFLSVVLRKTSLSGLSDGALCVVNSLFHWEPDWYRADSQLIATSFMAPMDVRVFGKAMESRTGLIHQRDWAVVDMATGPIAPAHWLAFRGGLDEDSFAWHEGTEPENIVRVTSRVPGEMSRLPSSGSVAKLFGRDSHHDTKGHRGGFGTLIPAWGGRDFWLLEVGAGVDGNGLARPGGYLSI